MSISDKLEKLVDDHGLDQVINALTLVCFEKAEHLRVSWQDEVSAKSWDNMGNALSVQAEHARQTGL